MIAAVTPTQPSTREAIVPGLVSGYFEWSPDFSKHFRNVQLLRSLQSLHAYFTIFRIFYGDIYIYVCVYWLYDRFGIDSQLIGIKHDSNIALIRIGYPICRIIIIFGIYVRKILLLET